MTEKYMPAYDFEQYFGKNPEEHFNAARIANAERVYVRCIEERQENALQNMVEMIEKMMLHISAIEPGQTMDATIDSIYAQSFSIKCNGGMYGYPLATAFANQLFYYCKEVAGKPLTVAVQACMQAHLNALRVIFAKNIRSMTDPAALELLKELERIGNL